MFVTIKQWNLKETIEKGSGNWGAVVYNDYLIPTK